MKSARTANLIGLALIGLWALIGWLVYPGGTDTEWLPKWALTFAVISPLAWIILYTACGFLGRGKWWRSDVGTNMVWMETAIVWTTGMILWAQWFNHGELDTYLQAWMYLGGVIAGGIVINWRSWIWLRNFRYDSGAEIRKLREENAKLRAEIGDA